MESEGSGAAAKTKTVTVTTMDAGNGNIWRLVKRDCGDYVEITPVGTLVDHRRIKLIQGVFRASGDQRPRDPSKTSLMFPKVSLKIPKNLPEDEAERVKIVGLAAGKAMIKMVAYMIASLRKSEEMARKRDQVEVVEQDTDDVKKKILRTN